MHTINLKETLLDDIEPHRHSSVILVRRRLSALSRSQLLSRSAASRAKLRSVRCPRLSPPTVLISVYSINIEQRACRKRRRYITVQRCRARRRIRTCGAHTTAGKQGQRTLTSISLNKTGERKIYDFVCGKA